MVEGNVQQPHPANEGRWNVTHPSAGMGTRSFGKWLYYCMEIVKDHSSMSLHHSHLCPGAPYSLLQSPQQGCSQEMPSNLSLRPVTQLRWHCWAMAPPLLQACRSLQPWLIPPTGNSHSPVSPLGSLLSLTQCLGCSPPAPHCWAVGQG